MKLTKFVHSCVLVETDSKAVLFDPGIFSWNSGVVQVDTLPNLDTIFVSHKHPDHLAEPFVRALVKRFPDVQWVAPADAHADLQGFGVKNVSDQSGNTYQVVTTDHAPVEPFGVQVQDMIVHWNNTVTSPGDTHALSETKDVLLLPVQAPWGTTIAAIELAVKLKPKFVLPIHDWMWNDDWRANCYDRFQKIFGDKGITFLPAVDGRPIEISIIQK